jgi:type VI protein secretion system component VasK
MNSWTAFAWIVGLLVFGGLVWAYLRQRRSGELRDRFGPEYDRTLRESGSRRQAESELRHREKRMERLAIRPLTAGERSHYAELWKAQQARFVDSPTEAIREADRLVEEVMKLRGYPVGEFEQRAADISVDHPQVAENYRAAHDIALRNQRGQTSTEDLRKAMIFYRNLFEELLEDRPVLEERARRAG